MDYVWEPDQATLTPDWEQYDADIKERALYLATQSLMLLTNYRVGTPSLTVRPCIDPNPCRHGWVPVYFERDAAWLNQCGCVQARWCSPVSEIDLDGPVGYIDSIKIDGDEQPLDIGNWRIDDGHYLVWQGIGVSPLPRTQNLNEPDTMPGTYSITYSKSAPVSRDGQIAVALLAMEFAKALKPRGGAKCALPKNVRSVTRLGVSFTIEAGLFPGGLTQIDFVDTFILAWAPAGDPVENAQVFDIRKMRMGVGHRRVGALIQRPGALVNPGFGVDGFGEGAFGL